jgi:hypothetical protein
MSYKSLSILAPAILAAGFSNVSLAQEPATIDLADPDFQACVQAAVVSAYPGAKGGFVAASNRHPSYRKYGDMLTYRERGISEINSVSVDLALDESKVIDVYTRTRKDLVILPSMLNGNSQSERDYMTSSHENETSIYSAAVAGSDEYNKTRDTHLQVIADVRACVLQ